jgi:hypothetical protein
MQENPLLQRATNNSAIDPPRFLSQCRLTFDRKVVFCTCCSQDSFQASNEWLLRANLIWSELWDAYFKVSLSLRWEYTSAWSESHHFIQTNILNNSVYVFHYIILYTIVCSHSFEFAERLFAWKASKAFYTDDWKYDSLSVCTSGAQSTPSVYFIFTALLYPVV